MRCTPTLLTMRPCQQGNANHLQNMLVRQLLVMQDTCAELQQRMARLQKLAACNAKDKPFLSQVRHSASAGSAKSSKGNMSMRQQSHRYLNVKVGILVMAMPAAR